MLDRDILGSLLEGTRFGRDLRVFDEIDSTNTYAMREPIEPYGVVVASMQRNGRGRSGRPWWSGDRGSAYVSMVLAEHDPAKLMPMNIAAGFAVVDALAHIAPVRLKWPNDIVCKGRKIAGILLETKASGARINRAVLGIGLNVNTQSFPPEISSTASSLSMESGGRIHCVEEVLGQVLKGIDRLLLDIEHDRIDIAASWARYSANLDKRITVHINDVPRSMTERGITPEGFLVAETDGGERTTVVTGDIGYDLHC